MLKGQGVPLSDPSSIGTCPALVFALAAVRVPVERCRAARARNEKRRQLALPRCDQFCRRLRRSQGAVAFCLCVIECLMLVKLSGVIRLGASFVSGFARSIEALADLFVAVGDPYVSVEAVCVLALIFWRGSSLTCP